MLQNCHPLPKIAETPTGMPRQGGDYPQWEWCPLAVVLRGEDVSTSSFALEERKGGGLACLLAVSICRWLFLNPCAALLLSLNNFVRGA